MEQESSPFSPAPGAPLTVIPSYFYIAGTGIKLSVTHTLCSSHPLRQKINLFSWVNPLNSG